MMWAVRNSSSCARLVKRVASLHPVSPQSFVAHSTCHVRHFSSEDEYLTGTVKFYIKNKAYGFIISDRDPSEEIWVHRKAIDTPHPTEEFPNRPYLLKDERVRFRVEPGEPGKPPKAVGLQFENGSQIPLFRKNYHLSVVGEVYQQFGAAVQKIMHEEELSDEEKWEQIKASLKTSDETIALAAARQKLYGPEVEVEGEDEDKNLSQ